MSQPKVEDNQPIQTAATEDHSGTERLKALADGLFGVVMTLLVLDLKLRHRKCITSGTSDRLYCCQQSEEVIVWLPSRSLAPLA